MNYPNDFNIPTFPAGKTVAFSRSVSVWIGVVAFLIICACGLMLLLVHSENNYPFLISTDPITSDWTVVAYPEKTKKIVTTEIVQENLVRNYVEYWFTIDKDNAVNESLWQKCPNTACEALEQYDPTNKICALFCLSGQDLFQQFTEKIVPEYRARIQQKSETIRVVSQLITPPAKNQGATNVWQSYAELDSSLNGRFSVLIFIELGYDKKMHPATLGYYVKDFNSYRMSGI